MLEIHIHHSKKLLATPQDVSSEQRLTDELHQSASVCLFGRRSYVMQPRPDPLHSVSLADVTAFNFLYFEPFNLIHFFDLAVTFSSFMSCFISFNSSLRCADKGNEAEMIIKSPKTVSWIFLIPLVQHPRMVPYFLLRGTQKLLITVGPSPHSLQHAEFAWGQKLCGLEINYELRHLLQRSGALTLVLCVRHEGTELTINGSN